MSDKPDSTLRSWIDSTIVVTIARLSGPTIAAIFLAFVYWATGEIQATHDAVTTLTTQMQERTQDRYTGSDARKDITNLLDLIKRNQDDISLLNNRQSMDEQFMYSHLASGKP